MPDFLQGKKQLSCKEANRSRCVAKVRWIIESGMFTHQLLLIVITHFNFIKNSERKDQTVAIFRADHTKF